MTRERIEDIREVVLPFVKKRLLEINYENLGESDAEMFAKDFDEILNLAIKALEQDTVSKESYDHEYFLRRKMEAEIDHLRRYISKLETQITLEQESTTKNDLGVDCISRQAAIDVIYNNEYKKDMRKELEQLPPVTPKEKTGHWIDDEFGSKCSCCSIHTHLDKFDRPMKFKYCSMCGAKMVEPQESEVEE